VGDTKKKPKLPNSKQEKAGKGALTKGVGHPQCPASQAVSAGVVNENIIHRIHKSWSSTFIN